ncbi:carbohydrate kinase family protein [Natrarchaeobius oligotrophus]|uniref:Carbohydrate kinase n=1 Tax=Natrarchaeobius chitinivorans TaxID=1679083 RepID=A0A3N6M5U5_NATCH|nr:carbohydrate kinase [Natrarchaeobius chitinivorans]RQG98943.1 carbohydrate kinase [Natrarchaeobius chitinivorans]
MGFDVLVAGETLIDFIPQRRGPTATVDGFERRPGGAPANVAVGLSRLEHVPLFWTRVGDDPFGRYLRDTLEENDVSDKFVETDPNAKTSLAFVEHDERGDRTFTFYRDDTADTRLEPGRIDDATLADLEWVHAGGVTLASGPSREATLDLLERASEAGATTSFDPNFRPELWPDRETFRSVTREALAFVDVLKTTGEELAALGCTEGSLESSARAALRAGPETAFVTRGAEGALAVTSPDGRWSTTEATHPGYEVDVVDATGAGDGFVAGAIAAALDGRSLSDSLAFANAVGAAATTEPGAMTALPDSGDVESMLE